MRHVDTDRPTSPNGVDTYVHYFYNSSWQIQETRESTVESTQPENLQPTHQYVWSARYPDSPILRDANTDQDSLCDDERFYYLTDANFNVTALVDTAGDSAERYLYDPYGSVTIYDGSWSSIRSISNYDNVLLYTGREYDVEAGLYCYRMRYFSTQLGRFVARDPIGLNGGDINYYRYVANQAPNQADPTGTRSPAARFEYVPNAVEWPAGILPPGPSAMPGPLSSSMQFFIEAVPKEFEWVLGARGMRYTCWKIGFVQITKLRTDICRPFIALPIPYLFPGIHLTVSGTHDWKVDGGIPYSGDWIDPRVVVIPKGQRGDQLRFNDNPGGLWPTYWDGTLIELLLQRFEVHLMCLSGPERGATYGGARWGHRFTWTPGFGGTEVPDYTIHRWATKLDSGPSEEFKEIVRKKMFPLD